MFYKYKKVVKIAISLVLSIHFCSSFALSPTTTRQNKTINSISYLLPTQDRLNYCNGEDMDSEGFKKTITKSVTEPIKPQRLSREKLMEKTIVLASKASHLCFQDLDCDDSDFIKIKIKGDTAYISSATGGWAGISIFMCAWEPIVEVNLLRFPEIKKVDWTYFYKN